MTALRPATSVQAQLLERVFESEVQDTPWLDRSNHRLALNRNGLPMPGKGRWQHSDVVRLIEDALDLQGQDSTLETDDPVESLPLAHESEAIPLVSLGLSDEIGDHPLIDVNGVLFRAGAKLMVPSHAPVARATIGDASGTIDRFSVAVGRNSTLQLEEQFESGNRVVICQLRDGATLDYTLTMPVNEGVGYHALVATLGEGAAINLHVAANGSELRRSDIVINLQGSHGQASLKGGWLLRGREHLDTQVYLNHHVAEVSSDQSFRGVVDERARSSFSGLIYIAEGAQGTEAHLANKNIAISPNARAHSQPELEIYTDDVICSHGATTGQLDTDAMFMLRSRGIPAETAQSMLLKGFLHEVIDTDAGARLLNL